MLGGRRPSLGGCKGKDGGECEEQEGCEGQTALRC